MQLTWNNFQNLFRRKTGIKEKRVKGEISSPNGKRYAEIIPWVGLALVITLMFPGGKSYQFADLKVGDIYMGEEVIAPFTFSINKSPEEYQRDLREARAKVTPVFVRADSTANEQILLLESFLRRLNSTRQLRISDSAKAEQLKSLYREYNVSIADENIAFILGQQTVDKGLLSGGTGSERSPAGEIRKTSDFPQVMAQLIRLVRDFYSTGILDRPKTSIAAPSGKISVRNGGQEVVENLDSYPSLEEARSIALNRLRDLYGKESAKIKFSYSIVTAFLTPNLLFDKDETQLRINEAVANVPLAKGTVLEKERIVDTHEKVTQEILEKLNSLAEAKAERETRKRGIGFILPFLGRFFLVALALGLLVLFLHLERPTTAREPKRLLLVEIIILLVVVLTFLVNRFNLSAYLIPVTVASMLLTVFFGVRTGFVGTVTLGILIGGMRGNEFSIAATSIFVGTVATLSVSKVRTRSWMVKSLLVIIAAYGVAITVMQFLSYVPFSAVAKNLGYGAINGFLSPILTYGLLIILEFVFDMTTDMTLLELSDLNQPLLRQLAMEAPGTYHHSIVVGNLAEAAAEAIGANSLLARVGAYYHDIGKMDKPEYFVENQTNGRNPHEKLAPSMSCLILADHIRQGLEIAQENNLPKEIQAFIAEHQGTNVMTYFYQKALERNNGTEVNENEFRYPGPRPQTKETGIVMLADAVEAASRSLKDPSASRIKGMVTSIVQDRFKESELDECPLTLRDLTKITDSFQNILLGIFHARVEYPDQDDLFFKKNGRKAKEVVQEGVLENQSQS